MSGAPTAVVVWGAWALMVAGALALVGLYGSNVPSWDGWDMVPTLTGAQPVTLEWLWSQHNEHRVPLPRLLLLGLNSVVIDFRLAMIFNVLATGALAAAMIRTAAALRGRRVLTDAFFPLLLLCPGQAANLLWGWQVQFFASMLLAGVALLLLLRCAPGRDAPTGVALPLGGCLVLLALCGANGLALVPGLAVWLLWTFRRRPAAVALAALALALTAAYFVGYEAVPFHPKSPGPRATLRTSVQFLSLGLGPAVRDVWPLSGVAALGLLVGSVGALAHAWRTRPELRHGALGLGCFLGAMASLALGLGLGRDGFETRYTTLALPAWCCAYFAFSAYAPRGVGAAGRWALLLLTLAALVPNADFGLAYARDLRAKLAAFEQDLEAGVPAHRLVARHGEALHPHHELVSDYLPMLRDAGVGRFGALTRAPLREVVVPLSSDRVLDLQRPIALEGMRLRYAHEGRAAPFVAVFWKRPGDSDFTWERAWKYSPTGDRANWERGTWSRLRVSARTTERWMSETIAALKVEAYGPGRLAIEELVLLVADDLVSAAPQAPAPAATARR